MASGRKRAPQAQGLQEDGGRSHPPNACRLWTVARSNLRAGCAEQAAACGGQWQGRLPRGTSRQRATDAQRGRGFLVRKGRSGGDPPQSLFSGYHLRGLRCPFLKQALAPSPPGAQPCAFPLGVGFLTRGGGRQTGLPEPHIRESQQLQGPKGALCMRRLASLMAWLL